MQDNERFPVCIAAFHNLHGTISNKELYRVTNLKGEKQLRFVRITRLSPLGDNATLCTLVTQIAITVISLDFNPTLYLFFSKYHLRMLVD